MRRSPTSPRSSRPRCSAPATRGVRLGGWLVRLAGLRAALRAAAADGTAGPLTDWLRTALRARRAAVRLFLHGFVARDAATSAPDHTAVPAPRGPHESGWFDEFAALVAELDALLPPGGELRRDCYVYRHRDAAGTVFYVGKGTARRAWSRQRSPVWRRYVGERLAGVYTVEIVRDGLTHAEALALEDALIAADGARLVNLRNPARDFDAALVERARLLRADTLALVGTTAFLEADHPAQAVERYRRALEDARRYTRLPVERGLLGDLAEADRHGEPVVLDRLTRCLERLGRHGELVEEATRYFAEFPDAERLPAGERVRRRVARATLAAAGRA